MSSRELVPLGQAILRAMDHHGDRSRSAAAKKIGTNRQNLENVMYGQTAFPKFFNGIAKYLGLPFEVLQAAVDAGDLDAMLSGLGSRDRAGMQRSGAVKVLGEALFRSDGQFDLEAPRDGDAAMGFVQYPSYDMGAYAYRVVGDACRPRARHGEFLIIEPSHANVPGDEVIVKTKAGALLYKQISHERDGRVELLSVNDAERPMSLALHEIESMHFVAGIIKSVPRPVTTPH